MATVINQVNATRQAYQLVNRTVPLRSLAPRHHAHNLRGRLFIFFAVIRLQRFNDCFGGDQCATDERRQIGISAHEVANTR